MVAVGRSLHQRTSSFAGECHRRRGFPPEGQIWRAATCTTRLPAYGPASPRGDPLPHRAALGNGRPLQRLQVQQAPLGGHLCPDAGPRVRPLPDHMHRQVPQPAQRVQEGAQTLAEQRRRWRLRRWRERQRQDRALQGDRRPAQATREGREAAVAAAPALEGTATPRWRTTRRSTTCSSDAGRTGTGSGGCVGSGAAGKSPTSNSKIDSYLQFTTDNGFEDANIPFGPVEANGIPILSIDDRLEDDRHPLPLTAADAVATNGVNPWNWRDTSTNGGDNHGNFGGRIILVKWGDYTKRIGIDGTPEAIKEAIKSAFGLRTRRAFWLEDEDEVVRTLDRDMPLGTYTLNLDDGMTIKLCDPNRMQTPEDKTFYTEEDFRDFLSRRGWTFLREYGSYRNVDSLDDLRPGVMYQGMRSLGD